MNSTWQRIIKAGKGILEIGGSVSGEEMPIGKYIKVFRGDDETDWVTYEISGKWLSLCFDEEGCDQIGVNPNALNHLEEIAQAFEEALEIWRKI